MTDSIARGVTRRTLAKGAAWTVPAVATVAAAPAMAASVGPLTFTGNACKLPGNSSSTFKGYVFELVANNVLGPNPLDTVTVITAVSVDGVNEPTYAVKVAPSYTCSCTNCGGGDPQFCTPDGVLNQQVLVYTADDLLGTSQNASMSLTYQQYECSGTTCVAFGGPVTISTPSLSTPPATQGGGSCNIVGVFPLPSDPPA